MQKINRTLRLFMVLILTISTVTTGLLPVSVASSPFTDVPDDAYYAEPVAWAVENNITKGTSDSTFSPDNGCTRAQVVTFLWRAAGQPDATKTSDFSDVAKEEYYTKAVSWAVEKDITKGIGEGKFDPNSTCTRAQIVTFLWRYKNSPASSKDSGFSDVSTDQYYAEPVTWAVENEITQGVGNSQFAPNNTCTRAQVVTFLYRTSQEKQDNLNDNIIDYGDLQARVEDGTIEVTVDNNGEIENIIGRFTDNKVTDKASAAELLNASSTLFGDCFQIDETQIQCEVLNQNTDQEESFYRTMSCINDVPVLGSEIILATDNNDHVTGLFSTYNEDIEEVYTDPDLEEEEAVHLAIAAVAEKEGLEESDLEEFSNTLNCDPMLAIYARNVDKPFLVYEVQVNSKYSNTDSSDQIDENDLGLMETPSESEEKLASLPVVNYTVEVAAGGDEAGSVYLCVNNTRDDLIQLTHTTEKLRDFNGSSTACKIQKLTAFGDLFYRLRDGDRNVEVRENSDYYEQGAIPMTEKTSDFRSNSVSLYKNLISTYDYYKNNLNRNSFDGNGKKIIGTLVTGNYNNACWDSGQESFFFGRSTNQEYAAALDIVGHEFTHAVVNYVVGPNGVNDDLEYYGETGALDEAYADIMGSFVESKNGNDRWNHGEDSGEIDRSFSNPSLYKHANHYRAVTESKNVGSYWYKELEQYVDRDYEGVHIFSGIVNHAAYLMMTDSRTSGVSKDTWANVFYNSMFRLQTDSLFTNHRGAIIATAKKLGFTSLQQQAIKDAFDKVGIEGKPWQVKIQPGTVDLDSAKIGEYVTFGHYEQDNNNENGKEPIVWKVLDKENDRALLLSKYVLDNRKYHEKSEVITWETCALRNWLNNNFLNDAFSITEKSYIPTVTLLNPDNPTFGTTGGHDTQDQVFLLSLQEMQQYFNLSDTWTDYDGNDHDETWDNWYLGGSKEVITSPTAYAKDQGAYTYSYYHDEEGRESYGWWLRSPGVDSNYTACVSNDGSVYAHGNFNIYYDSDGVRPALWVNLSS